MQNDRLALSLRAISRANAESASQLARRFDRVVLKQTFLSIILENLTPAA
jgi:hypothetical protein